MKALFGLVSLILGIFVLYSTVYGLYLAFSASIVLGFIVLLIEPAPFLLGAFAIFGYPEIAQKIASWIGL